MTRELRQIVYISRAAAGCDDDVVREIASAAAIRNQENGVTGLLLFDGHRFIQAIEGPTTAVQATMDRIRADIRHGSIEVATDRVVERRQFGSWSMETRRTPVGACSVIFLKRITDLMLRVDDANLQALFVGFAVMGAPAGSRKATRRSA